MRVSLGGPVNRTSLYARHASVGRRVQKPMGNVGTIHWGLSDEALIAPRRHNLPHSALEDPSDTATSPLPRYV